jgi:LPS-assembly lipoprotein
MKTDIIFYFSLITGLLVNLVSGCGFHLRGAVGDLHIQKVHIQSESAERIANEVKRILTEEGVQVVPTTKAAQVVVYLRNEAVDGRVLSVSSVSGKQEEIELNYRVEMEVRKPDDTVLLEKQTISLLRDYRFDETAVLAAGAEQETLRDDMFRDIVEQIIRRLQVLKIDEGSTVIGTE